jgi:hypothetical protein
MARRYIWSEFREERIEEASVEVEMPDGWVLTVPPAECWPDDLPATGGEPLFRAIVGDDEFDRFIEAGGTMKLLDQMLLDSQGVSSTGE